jgi:hypothetical protein
MVGRDRLNSLPQYDAIMMKEIKMPSASAHPIESVVHTIQEN